MSFLQTYQGLDAAAVTGRIGPEEGHEIDTNNGWDYRVKVLGGLLASEVEKPIPDPATVDERLAPYEGLLADRGEAARAESVQTVAGAAGPLATREALAQ